MIMNCGPGAPAVELGEPKTFVLAFDPNGSGEYFAPLVYVSDEVMHEFTIPYEGTAEYGTFLGWSTDPDATEGEYQNGDVIRVAEGTTTLYGVWYYADVIYALDIAVGVSEPLERCTYPMSRNIGGELYKNACYGYTPASGTDLNSWADDYDSGTGLISGIVPGTLSSAGVFSEASSKTTIPAGSKGTDSVTYIPTWYFSMTNDGETIKITFAREALDDTFHDYAGSIGDEHIGHFCMSCFDGSGDSSGIYSYRSGSLAVSISITNLIAGCQARGDGWDLMGWQHWTYMGALCAIIWRSTHLQRDAMYGASSAALNASSSVTTTKYGMYGTPGTSTEHMAVFWIMDLWGNISKFCGAHTNADRQLEWSTGYCSTTEWDMTGLSPVLDANASGYIAEVAGTTEAGFFPTVMSGGSSSTYFADYGYVGASNFPRVGCNSSTGSAAYGGPFYAHFYYSATNTSTYSGGRLVYRL